MPLQSRVILELPKERRDGDGVFQCTGSNYITMLSERFAAAPEGLLLSGGDTKWNG